MTLNCIVFDISYIYYIKLLFKYNLYFRIHSFQTLNQYVYNIIIGRVGRYMVVSAPYVPMDTGAMSRILLTGHRLDSARGHPTLLEEATAWLYNLGGRP